MTKKGSKIFNIVMLSLAFILSFAVGLSMSRYGYERNFLLRFIPYVQFLFGLFVIFMSVKFTKKAYQLFIGLVLSLWACSFLIISKIYSYQGFRTWWPLIGIIAGICLLISGIYKYKGLKMGFVIPSLVLIIIDIWYSLFSFKIVKISFSFVVICLGPLFLLLLILLIFAFYFIQKKHSSLICKDGSPEIFDDEEMSTIE
jgi:hypothetical protein